MDFEFFAVGPSNSAFGSRLYAICDLELARYSLIPRNSIG
jgi:hypothetical protein